MAGDYTSNLNLYKPETNEVGWGNLVNANMDVLDAHLEGWINSNKYASINAAVTAIGSTVTTLKVTEAEALTANLTIPSTLKLDIEKGGSIVKASTYTLTINGPFEAGLYQVFVGFSAGDVTFGSGAVKKANAKWWGAKGDSNTWDNIAIQSAIDSNAEIIVLPGGDYRTNDKIRITRNNFQLKGSGWENTLIRKGAGLNHNVIEVSIPDQMATRVDNILISDMTLDGNSNTTGSALVITHTHNSSFERIKTTNAEYGIIVDYSWSNGFYDIISSNSGNTNVLLKNSSNAVYFYRLHGVGNVGGGSTPKCYLEINDSDGVDISGITLEGPFTERMLYIYNTYGTIINGIYLETKTNQFLGTSLIEIGKTTEETFNTTISTGYVKIAESAGTQDVIRLTSGVSSHGTKGVKIDNLFIYSSIAGWTGDMFDVGTDAGAISNIILENNNIFHANAGSTSLRVDSKVESFLDINNFWHMVAIDNSKKFYTFENADPTPSVKFTGLYRVLFKTANTDATIIGGFDDGISGQIIKVLIQDAVTTIDFTGTSLKGNAGVDWSPSNGDWMECVYDGSSWFCSVHDCTA